MTETRLRTPVALSLVATALFLTMFSGAEEKKAPTFQMPWPLEVSNRAFQDDRQANYLSTVLELVERDGDAGPESTLRSTYLDVLGTFLALAGEHERALRVSDEAFGPVFERRAAPPEVAEPLNGFKPVDAVETIVARAKQHRLVLVNEEHRSTVQRAFAHRLLEPLAKLGFRYLALEAVHENGADLNKRGYPVLSTGRYTRDPVFGDLIRRAIELGYTIVPYEAGPGAAGPRPGDKSPMDAVNRRERAQAENLFNRTRQADPKARVLVLAGRDHIAEAAVGEWLPMGSVLKELSGLDPLTINLLTMTEHSERRFEHWAFSQADRAGWLDDEPMLLANAAGDLWSAKPGSLDASLFHPRTRYEEGRPHWMRLDGLRKPVPVELPKVEAPVLVQALRLGEAPDAVPGDQFIAWPGKSTPPLLLRDGRYRVEVLDRKGNVLLSKQVQARAKLPPP